LTQGKLLGRKNTNVEIPAQWRRDEKGGQIFSLSIPAELKKLGQFFHVTSGSMLFLPGRRDCLMIKTQKL